MRPVREEKELLVQSNHRPVQSFLEKMRTSIGARTHLRETSQRAVQAEAKSSLSSPRRRFAFATVSERKLSSAFSPCACRVDFAFAVVRNNMSTAQQGAAHSPVSSSAPSPSPGIVHHEGGMSTLVRSHPSLLFLFAHPHLIIVR